MRSMGHPDYVYQPRTDAQCVAQQSRALVRLGIPIGYCRIYGGIFPIIHRARIRKAAEKVRPKHGKRAAQMAAYDAYRDIIGYNEGPAIRISSVYSNGSTLTPRTVRG